MIQYRGGNTSIGMVIMCQVLIGIGGGILASTGNMGIFASSSHQEMASAFAILWICSSLGQSLGSAIAGTVWRSTFPQTLAQSFDDATVKEITGSLLRQLLHPIGHPDRDAIVVAYQETMKIFNCHWYRYRWRVAILRLAVQERRPKIHTAARKRQCLDIVSPK